MIEFERIRYKNILSTGDAWTNIKLTGKSTTLVIGENGAGKSTMLDALCFGLYGKAFRKVNLAALINSVNKKGLLVEVTFKTRGHTYRVVRGMKPKKFEVWKNDELLNQDGKTGDYQDELENDILQMNFKTFGQIVILGSSTFVPFMQLTAAARRDFIEDLLDLEVFSTMASILKDKISDVKSEIMNEEHAKEIAVNKLDSARKHNESIKAMKRANIEKSKKKAKALVQEVSKLDEEISEFIQQSQSVELEDVTELKDKRANLRTDNRLCEDKLSVLKKERGFYTKHDNCPTCKQSIDDSFKEDKVAIADDTITYLENRISANTLEIQNLGNDISEASKAGELKDALLRQATDRKSRRAIYMKTLKDIKDEIKEAGKVVDEVDQTEIDGLVEKIRACDENLGSLHAEHETQKNVQLILKDGGIRTRIIKQYIPIINKMINAYLSKMDFFVNFELDEQFKESIKSRHRDEFTYASFSEGEKAKIDISLMLTWRAVAKLRNSATTNLLVLDEIFDGSLDHDGVNYLSNILNYDVENSNIFVISHNVDQYSERFDRVLKYKKVKGFSLMEET